MSSPNLIGRSLGGRYRIDELLGQGGMSAVYKAYDPNLRRVVAIKVILPHLAGDPKFLIRFEEEAAAVAQLRHPNIVMVHDFSRDGDLYYMVQEFIPGETVQARIREFSHAGQRMPLDEIIRYSINICDATDFAHRRGMIHRDIKPANIMINTQGQAILMDFGIVKIVGGETHTATGAVIGTAMYLSPEMIRGEIPDGRSDMYSLGVTIFEMVSGRPPFESESAMSLMMKHLNDPAPDLRTLLPDTPAALAEIIARTLQKDKNRRYATMGELGAALRPYRGGAIPGATVGGILGTAPILQPYQPAPGQSPAGGYQPGAPTVVDNSATRYPAPNVPAGGQPGPQSPSYQSPYPSAAGGPAQGTPYQTPQPGGIPPTVVTPVPQTPAGGGWGGQAGSPPPGYTPTQVYPAGNPPRKNSRLPIIIVAIIAGLATLVVICVVSAVLIFRSSQNSIAEALALSETETAQAFIDNLPTDTPLPTDTLVPTETLFATDTPIILQPTNTTQPGETTSTPVVSDSVLDELSKLNEERQDIKQVAFTSTGGWVILFNRNEARWYDIPQDAADKILELNAAGAEIKNIAFTPEDGWVTLADKNDAWWNNIPQATADKIQELHEQDVELKQVAFTPSSGWVVLYDYNDAYWDGIPQTAADQIDSLYTNGSEIKNIAFAPDAGWVILNDRNNSWWNSIARGLEDALKELYTDDVFIRNVAFSPDLGWVLLYGTNGYYYDGLR